jgi:hypothetical protein
VLSNLTPAERAEWDRLTAGVEVNRRWPDHAEWIASFEAHCAPEAAALYRDEVVPFLDRLRAENPDHHCPMFAAVSAFPDLIDYTLDALVAGQAGSNTMAPPLPLTSRDRRG